MWIQYRAEHCMMSFLGRWFADGIATLRTSNVTMESVHVWMIFPVLNLHLVRGFSTAILPEGMLEGNRERSKYSIRKIMDEGQAVHVDSSNIQDKFAPAATGIS